MLEGRKKKQSESLFCKKKFSSLEFLLCLWGREHFTQGEVFDIGPRFQSPGKPLTPLSQLRQLLCSCAWPSSTRGLGWWGCREGWATTWMSLVWHQQPHPAVSPRAILFLPHFFLVSFQIPLRQVMMRMTMMSQKTQVIHFSGIQRPFCRSCGSQAVQLIWVFM